MKYVFSFLIALAITSISADVVWKLMDLSEVENSLCLADEEDSDEPAEEEQGDEEEKVKLKEHEWVSLCNISHDAPLVFQMLSPAVYKRTTLVDQHTSAVPYSPPEMM